MRIAIAITLAIVIGGCSKNYSEKANHMSDAVCECTDADCAREKLHLLEGYVRDVKQANVEGKELSLVLEAQSSGWYCAKKFGVGPGADDEAPSKTKNAEKGATKNEASDNSESKPGIDKSAARAALEAVPYKDCGSGGDGKVLVTFGPTGTVKSAVVKSGEYDSATKSCIESRFKKPKIPEYSGELKTYTWAITL